VLETPHVAVGAAIASKIPNPWLAIPLAFASHFILDKTLHWNPHTYTETQKYGRPTKNSTIIAAVDSTALVMGIGAASNYLIINHAVVILIACFASVAWISNPFTISISGWFIKWWIRTRISEKGPFYRPYYTASSLSPLFGGCTVKS
jgi:hypothetical protein